MIQEKVTCAICFATIVNGVVYPVKNNQFVCFDCVSELSRTKSEIVIAKEQPKTGAEKENS